MSFPRVTVICLCYNQGRFVSESIHSVLSQTHPNTELIVVDDASTDNSVAIIRECISSYPQIKFLPLSENLGNCKAFNRALRLSEGKYIIDLAADDVLLPDRLSKGIQALTNAGENFGVHFSDADWISEDGRALYRHSERFPHATIPEGDIYKDLIQRFFICSPTMMFRRNVIESLGGYDESLAYEDFDFWIRSSRKFFYCYTPEVLVKKRVVRNSMSDKQFKTFSPQLESTYRVCQKIMALNRSRDEQRALAKRTLYEIRVCLRLLRFPLVLKYVRLYFENQRLRF
jgi:glycosyltransferase involved in cell wall biosynthesis